MAHGSAVLDFCARNPGVTLGDLIDRSRERDELLEALILVTDRLEQTDDGESEVDFARSLIARIESQQLPGSTGRDGSG